MTSKEVKFECPGVLEGAAGQKGKERPRQSDGRGGFWWDVVLLLGKEVGKAALFMDVLKLTNPKG